MPLDYIYNCIIWMVWWHVVERIWTYASSTCDWVSPVMQKILCNRRPIPIKFSILFYHIYINVYIYLACTDASPMIVPKLNVKSKHRSFIRAKVQSIPKTMNVDYVLPFSANKIKHNRNNSCSTISAHPHKFCSLPLLILTESQTRKIR